MTRQWAAATATLFLYVMLAGTPARSETVYYKWIDKDGVTHYTNVKSDAPETATIDKVEPAPQPAPLSEQRPPRRQAVKQAPQVVVEEVQEPVQPSPPPPPAPAPRQQLTSELDNARQAERAFQTKDFKYLTPDEVTQYISEDDLKRMPRYGFDMGKPRIRRTEAIFYMRNKIKRLEGTGR